MNFVPTSLEGSYIIEPTIFADSRGWFARTFCKNEFAVINHTKEWLQLNHSFNIQKGTLRGIHYQLPPFTEIKLVRCIAGVIYDVIVDLRKNSPTFLQWIGVTLSGENRKMIYIPEGFGHGFQTLDDNCQVLYHHTEYYNSNYETGIRYNDALLNIQLPLAVTEISERDTNHSLLTKDFKGI